MTAEEAIALGKSRSDCAPENIDSLVALVRGLDADGVPGDVVECGSYRCGATIAMAAASPRRRVWACDIFGGLPYGARGFENFSDVRFEEVAEAVEPFCNIALVRGLHEETIPTLRNRVALLFLDSDHCESHLVCLRSLWPLLRPGSVVVFHDPGFEGVKAAIRATEAGFEKLEEVPGSPNMRMIRLRLHAAAAGAFPTRVEA